MVKITHYKVRSHILKWLFVRTTVQNQNILLEKWVKWIVCYQNRCWFIIHQSTNQWIDWLFQFMFSI